VVEHERVWAAVGERRVRFLTNVMGTWLLSETVRGWEAVGERIDLAELLEAAAADHPSGRALRRAGPRFLPPGDMPTRLSAWCAEHGVEVPQGPARLVRSIVLSLAAGFARAVDQAAGLSGRRCTTNVLVQAHLPRGRRR
jgi:rhamnulokinase